MRALPPRRERRRRTPGEALGFLLLSENDAGAGLDQQRPAHGPVALFLGLRGVLPGGGVQAVDDIFKAFANI